MIVPVPDTTRRTTRRVRRVGKKPNANEGKLQIEVSSILIQTTHFIEHISQNKQYLQLMYQMQQHLKQNKPDDAKHDVVQEVFGWDSHFRLTNQLIRLGVIQECNICGEHPCHIIAPTVKGE